MRTKQIFTLILFLGLTFFPVLGQKKGLQSINTHDLEMHMRFLASDELEGRDTGEPGLLVAARYLGVQADQLGLTAMDAENGFFQYYTIEEKSIDREKSQISILSTGEEIINRDPFYLMSGMKEEYSSLKGEVVFAGYGITDEEYSYDDLENVDIARKIVLVMDGAPRNEDGSEYLFGENKYRGFSGLQAKLMGLFQLRPRAVLLVQNPKSGYLSIDEAIPGVSGFLGRSRTLKDSGSIHLGAGVKLAFVHRSVADQLLVPSGKNLADLQMEIDSSLESRSFALDGVSINLEMFLEIKDLEVSNVFGTIEGSDPLLKDEMLIYVAHYDHVGTDENGKVFNGADDNASGTVALIEIAEAFMKERKRPARSIGILWVSAEEIGLFGSKYFSEHPMVPLENIVAVINLDMVSRTRSIEDDLSDREGLTIVGGDTVKVIGGLQSKVLMDINKQSLEEMEMIGNYEFNDLSKPGRYFYRSDHINFARKDIPVLFYSTGTHKDYHLVTDEEKLTDYDKFLKMTRFSYKAGFNVANYKEAIEVDKPMSAW